MTAIETKYQSLNGSTGLLGSPYSEELSCPDGLARYRTYDFGTIHWHPKLGAFETHGAIRDRWSQSDWERGPLRYPVSDEKDWSAHDLYNMLPINYLSWFFPQFAVGAWIAQMVIPSNIVTLGRWSQFEGGCITWWGRIKPPIVSDTWIWKKQGGDLIPQF